MTKGDLIIHIQVSLSHQGLNIEQIKNLTKGFYRKSKSELEELWEDEEECRKFMEAKNK